MFLLFFQYCSDQEFKHIINSLDFDYKTRKYEEIYEVKTITMLFFYFSDLGLYNKIKSDILREAKEYINYLKNHNKLDKKRDFQKIKDYVENQVIPISMILILKLI